MSWYTRNSNDDNDANQDGLRRPCRQTNWSECPSTAEKRKEYQWTTKSGMSYTPWSIIETLRFCPFFDLPIPQPKKSLRNTHITRMNSTKPLCSARFRKSTSASIHPAGGQIRLLNKGSIQARVAGLRPADLIKPNQINQYLSIYPHIQTRLV